MLISFARAAWRVWGFRPKPYTGFEPTLVENEPGDCPRHNRARDEALLAPPNNAGLVKAERPVRVGVGRVLFQFRPLHENLRRKAMVIIYADLIALLVSVGRDHAVKDVPSLTSVAAKRRP